jgi:hypothetical protein
MKAIIFLPVMICWGTFFGHTLLADIRASGSPNWLKWLGFFAGIAALLSTAYIVSPFLSPKKSPASSTRQSSEQVFWIPFIFFAIWSFGFYYIEEYLLPPAWAKVFPLLNICGVYLIWRSWPERKTQGKSEDVAPETGADSETKKR